MAKALLLLLLVALCVCTTRSIPLAFVGTTDYYNSYYTARAIGHQRRSTKHVSCHKAVGRGRRLGMAVADTVLGELSRDLVTVVHNPSLLNGEEQKEIYKRLVQKGLEFDSHLRRLEGVWKLYNSTTTTTTTTVVNNDQPTIHSNNNDNNDNDDKTKPLFVEEVVAVTPPSPPSIIEIQRQHAATPNAGVAFCIKDGTNGETDPSPMGLLPEPQSADGWTTTPSSSSTTTTTTSEWVGNKYIATTTTVRSNTDESNNNNNTTDSIIVRYHVQPAKDGTDMLVVVTSSSSISGNTTAVYGRHYGSRTVLSSPLARVRGCVANVQVKTTLVELDSTTNDNKNDDDKEMPTHQPERYRVVVDGQADAMISRGLLATVCRLTNDDRLTAHDVLELNPECVADQLHLRQTLSRGRNDGLASMTRTIQNQIHKLLSQQQQPQEPPTDPVVVDHNSLDDKTDGKDKATKKKKQPTVAMLLSGGVDSSVALNLLKQEGYNVTAFYLKIWLEDELAHLGQCPWEDDYRVCQQVCQQAGVPLETISLQQEYRERVISYTIQEAQRGRTPNPDIMCNARVKFGCFYDAIQGRGFHHVASGHYAQLKDDDNNDDNDNKGKKKKLFRAPDPIKDQSYFLCALSQQQLQRVLFPIGHLEKSRVRELALELDLPNKNRPDSQGLCFLGKVKFDDFLGAYLGERPGDIVDAATGDKLGRHRGVWYHTVGQRKGIGKVLFPLATSRGPWYVVAKDPEHNVVYASNQYDQEIFTAARSDFCVEDIQWIAGEPPKALVGTEKEDGSSSCYYQKGRFQMKIRHGPRLVEGSVLLTSNDAGNVELDQKDGGLAPGQYVVFYETDSDECLGGGVISERHWANFLLKRPTMPASEASAAKL